MSRIGVSATKITGDFVVFDTLGRKILEMLQVFGKRGAFSTRILLGHDVLLIWIKEEWIRFFPVCENSRWLDDSRAYVITKERLTIKIFPVYVVCIQVIVKERSRDESQFWIPRKDRDIQYGIQTYMSMSGSFCTVQRRAKFTDFSWRSFSMMVSTRRFDVLLGCLFGFWILDCQSLWVEREASRRSLEKPDPKIWIRQERRRCQKNKPKDFLTGESPKQIAKLRFCHTKLPQLLY